MPDTAIIYALILLVMPPLNPEPLHMPAPWEPAASMVRPGLVISAGGGIQDSTAMGTAAIGFDAARLRWTLGGYVRNTGYTWALGVAGYLEPFMTSVGFWGGMDQDGNAYGGIQAAINPLGDLVLFGGLSREYSGSTAPVWIHRGGIHWKSDYAAAWITGELADAGHAWETGIRLGDKGFSVFGVLRHDFAGDWLVSGGLRLDLDWNHATWSSDFTSGSHWGPWGTMLWAYHSESQPTVYWGTSDDVLLVDFSSPDSLDTAKISMKILSCVSRPTCRGVMFKVDGPLPLATAEEGARLLRFIRSRGRLTAVYAFSMDDRTYAMAASADRIYMFPGGTITFRGLSFTRIFLGDLLKRLGIKVELLRIGRFKSTPEMFERNCPSPASMQNLSEFAGDAERILIGLITRRPGMTVRRYRDLLKTAVVTPKEAMSMKLIDGMAYPDEMGARLSRDAGTMVTIRSMPSYPGRRIYGTVGICLLVLQGDIIAGRASPLVPPSHVIAGQPVGSALERCARDSRMAAILLRIDSPGGSAMASEDLWRKVRIISKIKPVVVSVGRRAASGGYYIASGGRLIFTLSSSLVGSIGVFGGKVSAAGLLSRAGIGVSVLKRAPYADMNSEFRPYTSDERRLVMKRLGWLYQRFIGAVVSSRRHRGVDPMKAGGGRVFTGRHANALGLTDRQGTFLDALIQTFRVADLPSCAPVYLTYPKPAAGLGRLIRLLGAGVSLSDWPVSLILPEDTWARAPQVINF